MAYFLGLVVALAAFWLGMSGHNTPLILSLGGISLIVTCILAYRLDIIDREGSPYVRLVGFLLYFPFHLRVDRLRKATHRIRSTLVSKHDS